MERLALHRQAIELLHLRQDARLQRIAARAEGIQRLAVAQEDSLLALVDDELAASDKVCHRVLPDEGFVVALITDDRRNRRIAHLGLLDFLLYVGHGVAHGACHTCSGLVRLKPAAARRAAEMHLIAEVGVRHQLRMTDGALGPAALGLVIDHAVPAGGAAFGRHPVGLDVDDIAAAAADALAGKKACGGFGIVVADGAGDDELTHDHSLLCSSIAMVFIYAGWSEIFGFSLPFHYIIPVQVFQVSMTIMHNVCQRTVFPPPLTIMQDPR